MTTRTPPLVRGFVAGHIIAGPLTVAMCIARQSVLAVLFAAIFLIALATWRQLP